MDIEAILKFAITQGYETAEYLCKWRGYDVYEPVFIKGEISCIGQPFMILVKGDEIRMSTEEEIDQYLTELE